MFYILNISHQLELHFLIERHLGDVSWRANIWPMTLGQRAFGQRAFGQRAFGQRAFGQRAFGQGAFGQGAFGQWHLLPALASTKDRWHYRQCNVNILCLF
jgi:hypothetical protein